MNHQPTAEEFLNNKPFMRSDLLCETNYQLMIEFAKLHVEEALKAASEDANMDDDYYQSLQVYPLENIK